MSYKSEMKACTAALNRRKKNIFSAIKITSILLALMLVATSVLVVIDAVGGNIGNRTEQGDDSSSLITPTKGKTVTVYAGDTVSYKNLVQIPAGYELEYTSNADLSRAGKYTVTYKLIKDGKEIDTYKLTLIVEERDVDRDELMTLIAAKAEALGITKEMSKVEQVQRIYDFVKCPNESDPYRDNPNVTIHFNDRVHHTSNIDPNRTAWETLWVKEAMLALERGEGDCYAYYSVSKAFFEYFGIENVGIQRGKVADLDVNGTHFWNMVNVGTAQNPQWYYYDATRLAGKFGDGTGNACLITLEKLQSYTGSHGERDFYHFDPTKYPTASTTPLS